MSHLDKLPSSRLESWSEAYLDEPYKCHRAFVLATYLAYISLDVVAVYFDSLTNRISGWFFYPPFNANVVAAVGLYSCVSWSAPPKYHHVLCIFLEFSYGSSGAGDSVPDCDDLL